ncbi:hypothetical protein CRG98_043934 [Punica granatum]|uniref:Uncharacterized protein n=1 Tax=Punica granatum TaxID=22663 RepID=A0A2I0HVK3_PUNGR|nr:hypothetical protein CRG98_043934 [Punica granatum]
MPGEAKAGFGVVVLNGKLLVTAGYSASTWRKLANMTVARYDFARAAVNGKVYAVGGYGIGRWGCFACGIEGKLYVIGGRSSFSIGNSRFVDIYNPGEARMGLDDEWGVMVTCPRWDWKEAPLHGVEKPEEAGDIQC